MTAPLNPMILYARLAEASAALGRQICLLDTQDPALASPVEAAWLHLDDLIELLPAALVWDVQRQEQEDDTP
jgi:hypothetical protein